MKVRRQPANALQSRPPRRLLDRILDTPHLAHVVPRLQPEVLQRIIQSCGLEDCGELVALATPDQLARVFDLDLWRAGQAGEDEQFDADRFGVWLEVLLESGSTVAARTLANMDADLVIAALAQHVLVRDPAAASASASADGDEMDTIDSLADELSCNVGGYYVVGQHTDSWDAIVAVLVALDAEHRAYFHRVMRGCRRLSNSTPEVDGLDDLLTVKEQVMFDLAFARERRREKDGYMPPAEARAFLQMSRQLQHDAMPPGSPNARAYFRAIESAGAETDLASGRLADGRDAPPSSDDCAAAIAAVVEVLAEEGVLAPQPRALLLGSKGHTPRLARIEAHMHLVGERDHAAFSIRSQELAYLANAIMAGCSIQARPFTAREASDAAVAVCNLGLENWPQRWLPDNFLVGQDLVSVFQVGWTALYDNVCMYAAEQLIEVLSSLRYDDREIQGGLSALRIAMTKHWQTGAPWRARDLLDVIMILDMPAWATLLGLIDECPVIHGGMATSQGSSTRTVSASAFEFISENSQIVSVREFMRALPETLRS